MTIDEFQDACYKGNLKKVKAGIESGIGVNDILDEGWTAICWSASKGHVEVSKYLIDQGADVNFQEEDEGESPLIFAIQENDGEQMTNIMKLLLDNGAKVDLPDLLSWTPLYHATSYKAIEAVKVLLSYGADPDFTGKEGGQSARMICEDDEILKLFN